MPRDRYDESGSSRGASYDDRNLPSIREVLRDELDRPVRPNPYSFGDVQRALPTGPLGQRSQWDGYPGYSGRAHQRGPAILPPIQQYAGHSSRAADDTRRHPTQGQRLPSSQHSGRTGRGQHSETEDPGYSYGVLRTSGTSGRLTDATPPSDRPPGILRQTAAPAREDEEDLNKRYRCDYCGKRFGMPSHLQIHLRTHTAQKPFACEWPGCDRSFSVRSNMMRHFRSHEKSTSSRQQLPEHSKYDVDDDDTCGEQEEIPPSSHYFQTSSLSDDRSSSQYYSSSRRK